MPTDKKYHEHESQEHERLSRTQSSSLPTCAIKNWTLARPRTRRAGVSFKNSALTIFAMGHVGS